jgi:hypothetical protein
MVLSLDTILVSDDITLGLSHAEPRTTNWVNPARARLALFLFSITKYNLEDWSADDSPHRSTTITSLIEIDCIR